MGFLSNKDKKKIHDSFGAFLSGKYSDSNLPDDAYIREGTYIEENVDDFKKSSFIIDIDSLRISYVGYFSTPSDSYTSENPVFDCPELSKTKYPETNCVGMYNSTSLLQSEQSNPIYNVLPIIVDQFDSATGVTTRFEIRGFFDIDDGNKFSISVIDYSCNNYEKALQMIRDKGFNPDDYTIKYQNECIFDKMPYSGRNSKGDVFKVSYTYTQEGKLYFLIDNYGCANKAASEESTMQAAKDWLQLYNFKLENYEYGILTLCNN